MNRVPNFSILDLIDIVIIFIVFQGENSEDQVRTILILSLTAIFLLTVSTILLILCWKRIRVSGFLFLPVLVKIDWCYQHYFPCFYIHQLSNKWFLISIFFITQHAWRVKSLQIFRKAWNEMFQMHGTTIVL